MTDTTDRDALAEVIDREWMRPEHDCDGTDASCAERCPRPAYQRMGLDELRDAAADAIVASDWLAGRAMSDWIKERRTRHYHRFYGQTLRGYGSSMDPHRCGDPKEPCWTVTEIRCVTPWIKEAEATP